MSLPPVETHALVEVRTHLVEDLGAEEHVAGEGAVAARCRSGSAGDRRAGSLAAQSGTSPREARPHRPGHHVRAVRRLHPEQLGQPRRQPAPRHRRGRRSSRLPGGRRPRLDCARTGCPAATRRHSRAATASRRASRRKPRARCPPRRCPRRSTRTAGGSPSNTCAATPARARRSPVRAAIADDADGDPHVGRPRRPAGHPRFAGTCAQRWPSRFVGSFLAYGPPVDRVRAPLLEPGGPRSRTGVT